MEKVLQRIFRLVRERDERVILLDPDGGDPIVIMPLSEYEGCCGGSARPKEPTKKVKIAGQKLADLTDDDLLNKINQEIVDWQEGEKTPENISSEDKNAQSTPEEETEGEEKFYIEPVKQ